MPYSPRLLFWDIETSHNLVAVFKLFKQDYIGHENLLQERFIICASWKWAEMTRVESVSGLDHMTRWLRKPHDDYHVVKTLHGVLSEADIIVAHNGDRFDTKFVEARMIYHGMKPLPPLISIDTLKVAKKRFLFNSNRLDYLGAYLGVGRKQPTTSGLWLRVLKGDRAAIREMVRYNRRDVLLLERVFEKLRPYVAARLVSSVQNCPRCAAGRLQARGFQQSLVATYQRYQCLQCGGWSRKLKSEKEQGERPEVRPL